MDPWTLISAVPIIARGVTETIQAATTFQQWWTGVTTNRDAVSRLQIELERARQDVRRLSDYALYAPHVHHARATNHWSTPAPSERDLVDLLDPVGRAMGGSVIASAPALLPQGMARELLRNPWELFTKVEPLEHARSPGSDATGVIFTHRGLHFIGWQTRGAISALMNDFNPAWTAPALVPQAPWESYFRFENATPRASSATSFFQAPSPPRQDNATALLRVLGSHKGKGRKLYVAPDIPSHKLRNAASHHPDVKGAKKWLGLIDYTFFGGAGRHTLFSDVGFHYLVDASPYTYQTFSAFTSYLSLGECSNIRSGTLGGVVLEVANSRDMHRFEGNEVLRDILIDIRQEVLAQQVR